MNPHLHMMHSQNDRTEAEGEQTPTYRMAGMGLKLQRIKWKLMAMYLHRRLVRLSVPEIATIYTATNLREMDGISATISQEEGTTIGAGIAADHEMIDDSIVTGSTPGHMVVVIGEICY